MPRRGKEFYMKRTHADRHRASPVYADGKIYLTARDGMVTVVKAGQGVRGAGDQHAGRVDLVVAGDFRRPHLPADVRRAVRDREVDRQRSAAQMCRRAKLGANVLRRTSRRRLITAGRSVGVFGGWRAGRRR